MLPKPISQKVGDLKEDVYVIRCSQSLMVRVHLLLERLVLLQMMLAIGILVSLHEVLLDCKLHGGIADNPLVYVSDFIGYQSRHHRGIKIVEDGEKLALMLVELVDAKRVLVGPFVEFCEVFSIILFAVAK